MVTAFTNSTYQSKLALFRAAIMLYESSSGATEYIGEDTGMDMCVEIKYYPTEYLAEPSLRKSKTRDWEVKRKNNYKQKVRSKKR
jgi:hypothetical protein